MDRRYEGEQERNMFNTNCDEFVLAAVMARKAGNAETKRNRAQADSRRLAGALTASQRTVSRLEAELAQERGRRLQREYLEIRRRLQ